MEKMVQFSGADTVKYAPKNNRRDFAGAALLEMGSHSHRGIDEECEQSGGESKSAGVAKLLGGRSFFTPQFVADGAQDDEARCNARCAAALRSRQHAVLCVRER